MIDYAILAKIGEAGAMKVGEILVEKVFSSNVIGNLFKSNNLTLAIQANIETSFDKCTRVKTILRDQREKFYEIYTSQRFNFNSGELNQNQVCDLVAGGDSFVIQGIGGGGKSMFIKYLWMYLFGHKQINIPILFELRAINLSNTTLKDFIYHSIVGKTTYLSQKKFDEYISEGKFVLIFDGFDEINHSLRDLMQKQILELKERNPKLSIVVTSRPDERFSGWQQFNTINVCDLNREECINVISRAPFDQTEKEKVIKIVSERLYLTHASFLENPLLTYMTLVTYSYNPNFSDRMFEFYEMAFDALYYRHDLTKGGTYIREFYSKLNKSSFQKLLSFFCLRSYYDELTEFSENILRDYIEKAKKYEAEEFKNVDTDLFIQDIIESVCILKKDGMEYTFTHRKFQEYFAAYCLARVIDRKADKFLDTFSTRSEDDVLGIVYDLNRNLFRYEYLLPQYKKHIDFFKQKTQKEIFDKYCVLSNSNFTTKILFHRDANKSKKPKRLKPENVYILYDGSGDFLNLFQSVKNIFDSHYKSTKSTKLSIDRDKKFIVDLVENNQIDAHYLTIDFSDGVVAIFAKDNQMNTLRKIEVSEDLKGGLNGLLMYEYLRCNALNLHGFVNQEMRILEAANKGFDEILEA
jgi:hypothetical protein